MLRKDCQDKGIKMKNPSYDTKARSGTAGGVRNAGQRVFILHRLLAFTPF
ncbi:MAG: hypothetical protein AB1847_20170 [bacterium]